AQLLGCLGGSQIRSALGIAAISDDQSILLLGETGGEIILDGSEVQRAGDMASLKGFIAVDVNDHRRFGFGELVDFIDVDVWELSSVSGYRDNCRDEECE